MTEQLKFILDINEKYSHRQDWIYILKIIKETNK